ncbi:MAG: M48 family metallopeptidase [Parachlamydiaceae bacterium]|nr:M48 family metallopeptidase [Parachlamydiaceae bacterium]
MNPSDNGYDNRGSPGRGWNIRLIGALIIVLLGFIMYMSNTQENPVTGAKQHVSLTPDQEIKLGLQAAPGMASQMGGEVSSSDPRYIEVKKMGNTILTRSKAQKGPWKFQFHLLNDEKTINAFALPGGQVFITAGLYEKLQTEAQLAGVLAHEMGHVIQRHSAQQMAKSQLGQMLIVATQVGTSDDRGNSAAMLASVVNQMMQLRYSRKDELEADQWGLILMTEAGYDPKAMIEVMDILEKSAGSGHGPEMLQTHPYPENRKAEIKDYLEKHPSKGNLNEGALLRGSKT